MMVVIYCWRKCVTAKSLFLPLYMMVIIKNNAQGGYSMEQSLKPLRYPLAALALTMLAACDRAPVAANAPGAPHVTVAKVIEQPITEWDEVTARLEAPETVEVRPRVSGQIERVAFTDGALVKKGDLLFQIDPRPFEHEVERFQAQLQQARATLLRTANEAQRGQRLLGSNAISAELADTRTTTAQEAKARALFG